MSDPLRAHAPGPPDPSAAAPEPPEERDISLAELTQRARERAEAEAAVDAVMRREEEKEATRVSVENRRRHAPPVKLGLLAALLAFNAYLWLGNPDWLRYQEPEAPSFDYYQGSWKIAVYLQRQRIEEYRQEKGHIPATAQQAGPPVHGVQYTPVQMKDYQLAAGDGARKFVYDSKDSLSVLMGRTLMHMGLISGGPR